MKRITDAELAEAVRHSQSFVGILRYLGRNQVGGSQSWIAKRVRRDGYDISHFTGQAWNRGGISSTRLSADEILVIKPPGGRRPNAFQLRRALLEIGRELRCALCGLIDWQGKHLVLDIDHINECYWDNRRDNLRFLCPNCHSQETIKNPT